MLLMILAGVFGVAALAVIGYMIFSNLSGQREQPKEELVRIETIREEPAPEPAAAKLQDEIKFLREELANIKPRYQALKEELESERKKAVTLNEGLGNSRSRETENQAELEALRKEGALLKEKVALLEKSSVDAAGAVNPLEAKVAEGAREIERLNAVIAELKKTEEPAGGVAQKEAEEVKKQLEVKEEALRRSAANQEMIYKECDELKRQLAEKESALANANAEAAASVGYEGQIAELKKLLSIRDEKLRVMQQGLEAAEKESVELKNQLQAKENEPAKAVPAPGISEEEYNKLKEKLESAEKVLRIMHGAG